MYNRPPMNGIKAAALIVLALAIVAIGVAYAATIASGGAATWPAGIMAIAIPFAMIATIALGAARTHGPQPGFRRLAAPFAAVLLIMLGAFAAALLLPAAGEPLLLGLPMRAAIVLYGVGVLPALILPLAYALTFDDLTLTEEDIARVREAAERSGGQG